MSNDTGTRFADGCVAHHDRDTNAICADWLRPSSEARTTMQRLLSEADSGGMGWKERLDAAMAVVADAWDEGAKKASPYGGAYVRSFYAENPHR